jgi:O-acetyl-ADP-ribose deacetylase (regulator of RNase III)
MRKFVEGNILEADVEALVNTVNTVGIMGKGIALQFKRAYPEMFRAYEAECKAKRIKLGKMHVYDRGSMFNPRYIINFPTKQHWKGKSTITNIESGLDALVGELLARNIKSVAIPPLGCGLGGLDWNEVRPLIERAIEQAPGVEALIYVPKGAPKPSAMVNRTKRPEMTTDRANMIRLLSEYCVLGYELTLLEIQKIFYLLQATGEPLRLCLKKDTYGPYADNFRHVLNRLEGHFLEGYGDGNNGPKTTIRLLDDAVREAKLVSELSSDFDQSDRVHRVFEVIEGFESPYGMELLASVHWVAINEGVGHDPELVVRAVHEWNNRKREVMKREHILVAWNRLRDLNWISQEVSVRAGSS